MWLIPPGSQLCTVRGISKGEPGGWYGSSILLNTPPPGTWVVPKPLGSRPAISGNTCGGCRGVTTPVAPAPRCVGSSGDPAATPHIYPLRTLGTVPTTSTATGMLVQTPLYISHTWPETFWLVCGKAGRTCSLSSVHYYRDQPGWRGPWGCCMTYTYTTSTSGLTILVCCPCINTTQGPAPTHRFPTRPPLLPTPLSPSVGWLIPLPHCILWGTGIILGLKHGSHWRGDHSNPWTLPPLWDSHSTPRKSGLPWGPHRTLPVSRDNCPFPGRHTSDGGLGRYCG